MPNPAQSNFQAPEDFEDADEDEVFAWDLFNDLVTTEPDVVPEALLHTTKKAWAQTYIYTYIQVHSTHIHTYIHACISPERRMIESPHV